MAAGREMEYSVMKLHAETNVFIELIIATAQEFGLPQVYVEKDYWVTRSLRHLSESDHTKNAIFKGGTSLSKAYRIINRFSEDIDLAVFASGKGDSARKNLLKSVEKIAALELTPIANDERVSKGSKYRKTVYQYPRQINSVDFGQASPELIIEVNAFADPEPFEPCQLQTLIAEVLKKHNKADLIKTFDLEPFSINVLSVKRTLVEKILGVIKDSYYGVPTSRLSNRIRHLYDIHMILLHDEHRSFISSNDFQTLCIVCIEAEKNGIFNDIACLDKPLQDAPLFSEFNVWSRPLSTTYNGQFSDMVYGDLPTLADIGKSLEFIRAYI